MKTKKTRGQRDDDAEVYDLLDALKDRLPIDKLDLDSALETQADNYHDVAEAHALAVSQRDEASQLIKDVEAHTDSQIREEAREKEEKTTENDIKARIRAHPDVERAHKTFATYHKQTLLLSAMKDAFEQRSRALTALTSLYNGEYFTATGAGVSASQIKDAKAREYKTMRTRRRRADT